VEEKPGETCGEAPDRGEIGRFGYFFCTFFLLSIFSLHDYAPTRLDHSPFSELSILISKTRTLQDLAPGLVFGL
jgi:hypothetical protein